MIILIKDVQPEVHDSRSISYVWEVLQKHNSAAQKAHARAPEHEWHGAEH